MNLLERFIVYTGHWACRSSPSLATNLVGKNHSQHQRCLSGPKKNSTRDSQFLKRLMSSAMIQIPYLSGYKNRINVKKSNGTSTSSWLILKDTLSNNNCQVMTQWISLMIYTDYMKNGDKTSSTSDWSTIRIPIFYEKPKLNLTKSDTRWVKLSRDTRLVEI